MLRGTAYEKLEEAQSHCEAIEPDQAIALIEEVKLELTHGEDVSMTIVDKHRLTVKLSYGTLERLQWLAARSRDDDDRRIARELYHLIAEVDVHA